MPVPAGVLKKKSGGEDFFTAALVCTTALPARCRCGSIFSQRAAISRSTFSVRVAQLVQMRTAV